MTLAAMTRDGLLCEWDPAAACPTGFAKGGKQPTGGCANIDKMRKETWETKTGTGRASCTRLRPVTKTKAHRDYHSNFDGE